MDIKRAEDIIRKDKSIKSVWYGFKHDNVFSFVVSPHDKVIIGDPEAYCVNVDASGNISKQKFPLTLDASDLHFIDMDKESLGSVPQY